MSQANKKLLLVYCNCLIHESHFPHIHFQQKKKKNFCSWRIERLVGWILFCFFLSPRCLSPIVSFLGLAPFPPSSDRAWDWDWNWDWDWDWDWDWGELFLFSGLPKGTKTSKLKKKIGKICYFLWKCNRGVLHRLRLQLNTTMASYNQSNRTICEILVENIYLFSLFARCISTPISCNCATPMI